MKPKPLSSLNHLTVPVPITEIPHFASLSGRDRPRPCPAQPTGRPTDIATPASASPEGGFAGSHFEERADGVLEVLGVEQGSRDLRDEAVRMARAALRGGAHEPLG